MRTNIVLDDDLVKEALELTGIKTKRELVHEAIKALIKKHRRKNLLDIRGRIEFDPDYDYKSLREGRE